MTDGNPFTAPFRAQREFWERATDTVETAAVAPERVDRYADIEVGTTPADVVYEENKLQLLRYDAEAAGIEPETQQDVPILIVYALINRSYILDLQPDRSVVRRLLEAGFDVYLIDWGEPSLLDSSLSLQDYVDRYIDNCVDEVRAAHDLDSINLLGYCMGGTMSAMYAALFPEKVRNLGLMAAGLCFAGTGGILELWGDEDYYDPGHVSETFGNVPAEFLDVGFALMDPVQNYVSKYIQLYENLENEDFIENFARMERWLNDGIDLAGEAYREFLEDVYQENKLYRNELQVNGRTVDLAEIDMPVLQIIGEYDHLIPPEASKPFNDAIASEDTEIMEYSTGHIGLSVSGSSHANLWPDVAAWFATRSDLSADSVAASTDADSLDSEADAVDETDAHGDPTVSDDPDAAADAAATDLTVIQGIGPAYATRLQDAGIESVADLAAADPGTLADRTDLSETRLRQWVDAAADLS